MSPAACVPGDDCIALKSGMDADGRAVGIPTVNVTVRNTHFLQGHGCSIGSDMSGGVANAVLWVVPAPSPSVLVDSISVSCVRAIGAA